MIQFWKVKRIPVDKILFPFIDKFCPEMNNNRIIGGATATLHFTAIYADVIGHKLTKKEIEISTQLGALMFIVDDIFDHQKINDVSEFINITASVLDSTIKGKIQTEKDINISDQEEKNYVNLKNLALSLYENIIDLLGSKEEQKKNLANCLRRTQHLQELSLQQKKEEVEIEFLRKLTSNKGGYTSLLCGYIIDSDLPPLENEDLYEYSKMPLNQIEKDRFFWRRQFLFELGSLMQYMDDKFDVEYDQKSGIETLAIKQPLSLEEENLMRKRVLKLYSKSFKKDVFFLHYYLSLLPYLPYLTIDSRKNNV